MNFTHLINPVAVQIAKPRKVKFDATEAHDYEYKRAHYLQNKETYLTRSREWWKAHPEERKATQHRYDTKPEVRAHKAAMQRLRRAKLASENGREVGQRS